MRLYQEYLKRHGITDVIIPQHTDYGTLFFRGQNENQEITWRLLLIQYQPDNGHPGHYTINWMQPIHDGRSGRSAFIKINPPEEGLAINLNADKILDFGGDPNGRLEWDQYEDYIQKLIKTPIQGFSVIKNQIEIALTAWEMFVFCNDSELARLANKDALFRSLDLDLPLIERHQGYQEIIYDLEKNYPACFELWCRDMLTYIKKYSHWLANFCDENAKLRNKNV